MGDDGGSEEQMNLLQLTRGNERNTTHQGNSVTRMGGLGEVDLGISCSIHAAGGVKIEYQRKSLCWLNSENKATKAQAILCDYIEIISVHIMYSIYMLYTRDIII